MFKTFQKGDCGLQYGQRGQLVRSVHQGADRQDVGREKSFQLGQKEEKKKKHFRRRKRSGSFVSVRPCPKISNFSR